MDPTRRQEFRRWRAMARSIAKLVPVSDSPGFIRCSGLVACPVCGLEFYDHPYLPQHSLYLACDGTLMHL